MCKKATGKKKPASAQADAGSCLVGARGFEPLRAHGGIRLSGVACRSKPPCRLTQFEAVWHEQAHKTVTATLRVSECPPSQGRGVPLLPPKSPQAQTMSRKTGPLRVRTKLKTVNRSALAARSGPHRKLFYDPPAPSAAQNPDTRPSLQQFQTDAAHKVGKSLDPPCGQLEPSPCPRLKTDYPKSLCRRGSSHHQPQFALARASLLVASIAPPRSMSSSLSREVRSLERRSLIRRVDRVALGLQFSLALRSLFHRRLQFIGQIFFPVPSTFNTV